MRVRVTCVRIGGYVGNGLKLSFGQHAEVDLTEAQVADVQRVAGLSVQTLSEAPAKRTKPRTKPQTKDS